jgi:hypothetical protein
LVEAGDVAMYLSKEGDGIGSRCCVGRQHEALGTPMLKNIEWRFQPRTVEVVDRGGDKREEIEAGYQLELTSPKGIDKLTIEEGRSPVTMTIAPGKTEVDYDVVLFARTFARTNEEKAAGRVIARGNSPDEAMRRGLDKIRELMTPAMGLLDAAEDEFDQAERPPWRLYRCSSAEGADRFVVARTPICARGFYIQREKVPPGTQVDCRDVKELLPTAKRIIPTEKHPDFLLGYASREMLNLCGMQPRSPGMPLPQ